MAETILQSFLNSQLIKTSDDGNIANLKKAVAEIKKKLGSKKALVIPYSLAAFDPEVHESEPVIVEVEKIIIKKWSAFKNSISTTKDTATTYVRAVILEALSQLTKPSDEMAVLVWLTIQDLFKHYEIGDKELKIVKPFLQILVNKSEEAGRNNWQISSKIELDVPNTDSTLLKNAENSKVSATSLEKKMLRAFIYTGWKDQSQGHGDNPSHASVGNWRWEEYVAMKSSRFISEEVNLALNKQNENISSLNSGIDKFFQSLAPLFQNITESITANINNGSKRNQLLWWKQSLYSQSIQTSYRTKSLLENTVLAAIDLADMVNPMYPESVDYLLRETLRDVHGEAVDRETEFQALVDGISQMKAPIKELLTPLKDSKTGRKLLISQLGNIASSSEEGVSNDTGIPINSKVTYSDFAIWLFHNLQALKLASKK